MFKKISLLLLAISSSYAMESFPNTPTGDNNIKQTTEDIKSNDTINNVIETGGQNITSTKAVNSSNKDVNGVKQNHNNSKDTVNEMMEEFSIFGINKIAQQLNNIDIDKNDNITNDQIFDIIEHNVNINDIKIENKSYEKNIKIDYIDKDWEKMTELERERYLAQRTHNLTDTKKKLLKVELCNRFSKSCQNFIQNVFNVGDANFNPKKKFYNATIAKFGVMIGLKLEQIFSDTLKYEINLNNYDKYPNFANVEQQLQKVCQHLILVGNQYKYILQKRGYIKKF